MSDDKRVDPRSPEEIQAAQKGLLKILGFATFVPIIWVVLMAWNGFQNMDNTPYGDVEFAQFIVTWGLLSPIVWISCYGYTYFQIRRGNMNVGAYLPMIPALWIVFWFTIQFVRQSDWFM